MQKAFGSKFDYFAEHLYYKASNRKEYVNLNFVQIY